MREREEQEHHVAFDREVLDVVDLVDHRVVVAVPDHAGLRRPGRARGVDVRVEVVLADLRGGALEAIGFGPGMVAAASA